MTKATGSGSKRKSATPSEQKLSRTLAFLVARAIGRRGTKPNRWFKRVFERDDTKARVNKSTAQIGNDLSKVTAAHAEQAIAESINKASKGFAT